MVATTATHTPQRAGDHTQSTHNDTEHGLLNSTNTNCAQCVLLSQHQLKWPAVLHRVSHRSFPFISQVVEPNVKAGEQAVCRAVVSALWVIPSQLWVADVSA